MLQTNETADTDLSNDKLILHALYKYTFAARDDPRKTDVVTRLDKFLPYV